MWRPSADLQPLNRLLNGLEQKLLAVYRGGMPLVYLLEDPDLPALYEVIDTNPYQAVLFTRIKTGHALTPRHALNVLLLARAWVVSKHRLGERLDAFCLAALFHDLGHWQAKDLLYVMGPFTHEQFRRMQQHPRIHNEALAAIDPDLLTWIAQHHEQPDGRGYPEGITDPHPLAQVIRLCDCYDGLTTPRRFRPAYTPLEAMRLMGRWAGYKFDRALYTGFRNFIGETPGGSFVRLDVGGGVSLPPEDGKTPILLLTNADGDELPDPERITVAPEEITGDARTWRERLPDAWKGLRPDMLGLPRS